MKFRLEKLGPTYKKSVDPACACCGYEADWLIGVYEEDSDEQTRRLERYFCERDMRDAILDAMNFNTLVPDALPLPL